MKRHVPRRAMPFYTEDIRAALQALDRDSVTGKRDAAALLVGFAGALRVSEIVGLDVGDVEFVPEGMVLTIRWSKTDHFGEGHVIGIPAGEHSGTCPVAAVADWLAAAGFTEGALLRGVRQNGTPYKGRRLTRQTVSRLTKEAAVAAGLDPALYSSHSLRAGHVTQANLNGASDHVIADQTRHAQLAMLRVYRRPRSHFKENSADYLGL